MVRLWAAGRVTLAGFAASRRQLAVAVAAVVLVANAFGFANLASGDWMTRANANWDALVARLDRELPAGTTLYFRKVSPRYDLERRGRTDIRFRELIEGPLDTVKVLSAPGPILFIALRSDLDPLGDLSRLGYGEVVPPFGDPKDPAGQYVVLLK